MDRREFLRRVAALGAGTLLAAWAPARLLAAVRRLPAGPGGGPALLDLLRELEAGPGSAEGRRTAAATRPDLVAVKGASPARMFQAGIAALGGMGSFVKKGATVVVKPNIGWDVPPERAANSDPRLVGAIVEAALAAGARKVWVFDHSCDSWKASYRNSGIEAAAREAGASVAPADTEAYYQPVSPAGAATLGRFKVHELVLEADVLINVPVLKSHGGAGMTCALKNLMGAVWDRGAFHARNLDLCIAESALAARPALTVVDASRVMLTGGPRGNGSSRYAELGMQILSTDIVAADAAASKAFGPGPKAFPYIAAAERLGLGRADLERLLVERLDLA